VIADLIGSRGGSSGRELSRAPHGGFRGEGVQNMRRMTWNVLLVTLALTMLAGAARAQRGAGSDFERTAPGDGRPGPGGPGFGPSLGWDGPPGMRRPSGMPGPRGIRPDELEALGLSDAQRRQLDTLRDGEIRESIRLDADARIAELDLERLIEVDKPDPEALARQVDKITGLRSKLLLGRVNLQVAIRGLLAPQQRTKLRSMRATDGPRR
jgi:Spy/CpxP family protein refolding chaperone